MNKPNRVKIERAVEIGLAFFNADPIEKQSWFEAITIDHNPTAPLLELSSVLCSTVETWMQESFNSADRGAIEATFLKRLPAALELDDAP